MAQFDVFVNENEATSDIFPYVLDVQYSLHDRLNTRMVIPIALDIEFARGLYVSLDINGEKAVAIVPEMAGIPIQLIGKKVDNLANNSSEIINAIDFLITGF